MEQIKLSKKQKYSYKMQKYVHFYSPELWASNSWTEKEKPISKILPDVNPFEMNISLNFIFMYSWYLSLCKGYQTNKCKWNQINVFLQKAETNKDQWWKYLYHWLL